MLTGKAQENMHLQSSGQEGASEGAHPPPKPPLAHGGLSHASAHFMSASSFPIIFVSIVYSLDE